MDIPPHVDQMFPELGGKANTMYKWLRTHLKDIDSPADLPEDHRAALEAHIEEMSKLYMDPSDLHNYQAAVAYIGIKMAGSPGTEEFKAAHAKFRYWVEKFRDNSDMQRWYSIFQDEFVN